MKAEAILKRLLPPDPATTYGDYKTYVMGKLSGPEITLDECRVLMTHFGCSIDQVVMEIARHKCKDAHVPVPKRTKPKRGTNW